MLTAPFSAAELTTLLEAFKVTCAYDARQASTAAGAERAIIELDAERWLRVYAEGSPVRGRASLPTKIKSAVANSSARDTAADAAAELRKGRGKK